VQEVDDICKTKLHDLQPNTVLGAPDPKSVQAWTHIDARASLASAHRKLQRMTAMSELQGGRSSASAAASRAAAEGAVAGKGWRKLVAEYRRRLLHVVKAKYGEKLFVWAHPSQFLQLWLATCVFQVVGTADASACLMVEEGRAQSRLFMQQCCTCFLTCLSELPVAMLMLLCAGNLHQHLEHSIEPA
jgi:hypothetical protein